MFRILHHALPAATGLLLGTSWAIAQCACGPDFCQDDSRVAGALATKKAELSNAGYPKRLIDLIDVGQQCFARIDRSPDIFTMWMVDSADTKQTVPWSIEQEDIALAQVQDGRLKRFWIYNAKQAFSCCDEPRYDERADYDDEDEVSKSTAILCKKSGDTASCSN